jgi:hypothetical protein
MIFELKKKKKNLLEKSKSIKNYKISILNQQNQFFEIYKKKYEEIYKNINNSFDLINSNPNISFSFNFNSKLNEKLALILQNLCIKDYFNSPLIDEKIEIDLKNNLMNDLINIKIPKNNEIDITKIGKKFSYENLILKKINNDGDWSSVPLQKISKKNCDTDANKFSFKIINTSYNYIFIGLVDSNFNFSSNIHIGQNSNSWGFHCSNGHKYHNGNQIYYQGYGYNNNYSYNAFSTTNDIVGLKYNSKIGTIEIFKNETSLGIIFNNIDTTKDYFFGVSLCYINDSIQIIQ